MDATITMPKKKPSRTYIAAKISARALQLAKIVCAYEPNAPTQGELMSDILEPILLKRVEKLGAPVPPHPDPPK